MTFVYGGLFRRTLYPIYTVSQKKRKYDPFAYVFSIDRSLPRNDTQSAVLRQYFVCLSVRPCRSGTVMTYVGILRK